LHTDASPFPASKSSLAPAFEPDATQELERPKAPQLGPQIVPQQTAPPVERRREPAYQASLFGPQEVRRVQDPPVVRQPKAAPPAAPKPKRQRPAQKSLEFPEPEKLTTVQSSIYCNAMVAPAPLRVAAVIFDLLYPCAAVALFWSALHFSGEDVALAKMPVWMYGAILVLVTALYRLLYSMGNADTPGVRWAGLKLLDFDGRQPTRDQRLKRLFAGCISIVAAGLGVIWALLDEEKLTWHDHMSGTFATIADQSLFIAHR
jgi:uncharacterized RDD family membrane protein YckC